MTLLLTTLLLAVAPVATQPATTGPDTLSRRPATDSTALLLSALRAEIGELRRAQDRPLVRMKPYLDSVVAVLTLLTLGSGLYFGVRRFGLQRESATFLRVLVAAKEVTKSGELVLTSLTIRLDNLGQTRIDARTKQRKENGFHYDDGWDRFQHAGTLKIRRIARAQEPLLFDWYALPPTPIATTLSADAASYGEVVRQERDLEQINYLDDYQDPAEKFAEVHFWLEPKESYELLVSVWLPAGIYEAKAVFLGKEAGHENEEYWSHVCTFTVGDAAGHISSCRAIRHLERG